MWRDLLLEEGEAIVSPWTGGRSLRTFERAFGIEGALPPEHGWHSFAVSGRKVRWRRAVDAEPDRLRERVFGYLIGDRLVPDEVRVQPELGELCKSFERVALIELGLDRFARVCAGRFAEAAPLIFVGQELPLGPESDVLSAFYDGQTSLAGVPHVPPALDAAFRVEIWRRQEAERRRREAEAAAQRAHEALERERRERELRQRLGEAVGRRELAAFDFASAARASLELGGAEYVDHQSAYRRGEINVRFRLDGARYVCTCDERTLRIIDSGICLVDHQTGEKGDARFTLESLPAVIRQAERDGVLVVFRHFD